MGPLPYIKLANIMMLVLRNASPSPDTQETIAGQNENYYVLPYRDQNKFQLAKYPKKRLHPPALEFRTSEFKEIADEDVAELADKLEKIRKILVMTRRYGI